MARVVCSKNGPYIVTGGVALQRRLAGQDGATQALPRRESYALCRCGHSRMKPHCDYKHMGAKFDGTETASLSDELTGSSPLDCAAPADATPAIVFSDHARDSSDGPFLLLGDIEVVAADGSIYQTAGRRALCRCGRSAGKPFCDGSHAGRTCA